MTELARTRFRGPVLDARDAIELARFHAGLLGWTVMGADRVTLR